MVSGPKRISPQIHRDTFSTSREMDFISETQLAAQTGYTKDEWPASVIVKELLDNALDACEEHNIAPIIKISVDAGGITVWDNGCGIPADTIDGMLDFSVRVSSREAYCGPTRGAQGNALKTLVGIPHALDRERGRLIITTDGKQHTIVCDLDSISQKIRIERQVQASTLVGRRGDVRKRRSSSVLVSKVTRKSPPAFSYNSAVRVEWASADDWWAWSDSCHQGWFCTQIKAVARGYALFNPHLTITLDWLGTSQIWIATDPQWKKWRPCDPESAHWFTTAKLARLIGAYINLDRQRGNDRFVGEFLSEFDGLTSSGKQRSVLAAAGMRRTRLSELVTSRHELDEKRIGSLLKAMKSQTLEYNPRRLGQIGEEHFRTRLDEFGCDPESIQYRRKRQVDNGLPSVIETAFGKFADVDHRQLYCGANWSAGTRDPFRDLSTSGEGMASVLTANYAGGAEPICFAAHLAMPGVEYTDRGKSAIMIPSPAAEETLVALSRSATKKWFEWRKRDERANSRRDRENMFKTKKVHLTTVAVRILPAAYAAVSDNGQLQAATRQLFYESRDAFREMTGLVIDYDYFRDHILRKFLKRPETLDWKVTRDARGSAREPHTERNTPCSTLGVDRYLEMSGRQIDTSPRIGFDTAYPTCGPQNRFQAVLYIEKEGFNPLFEQVQLAERFDICIILGKGQSVIAARKLADMLCHHGDGGVPLLVLHDFDKYGFSICQNLARVSHAAVKADTVAYEFKNEVNVIDLGLRLEDVRKWNLKPEVVQFIGDFDPGCDITEAEKEFLRGNQRVELNAFRSRDLVDFIEEKLRAAGITEKLIPDDDVLADAYRRAQLIEELREVIAVSRPAAEAKTASLELPAELRVKVADALEANPARSWDDALYEIVREEFR